MSDLDLQFRDLTAHLGEDPDFCRAIRRCERGLRRQGRWWSVETLAALALVPVGAGAVYLVAVAPLAAALQGFGG